VKTIQPKSLKSCGAKTKHYSFLLNPVGPDLLLSI
jgi:hypothetical protein